MAGTVYQLNSLELILILLYLLCRSSCFMFAVGVCSLFAIYKIHLCSVLIGLGHVWNRLPIHIPVPCLVTLCRPAIFFLWKWPFPFGFSSSSPIKHTCGTIFHLFEFYCEQQALWPID